MTLLIATLRDLLLLAEVILLLPAIYLVLLSVAALRMQQRREPRARQELDAHATTRFALLVPAHDEAAVIGGVLESIAAVDYPAELYSVIVIADNCVDKTAALARAAGATVYERFDDTQRAKGYALRWMIEQLLDSGAPIDAFVVVDADSRLTPNFLRRMDATLAAGADVAQAQYRVLNSADGWTAGLRAVAFALFNHLRPLGRAYFGWSAGLKGNGMCFRREVFTRLGWESYSLAEDAEYHLRLIEAGIHVVYVPDAIVFAEMPTTLRQARSQQDRWEQGRLELARGHFGALLRGFARDRDFARLDAAMEVLLPPLSLVAGLNVLCVVLAVLLGWSVTLVLAVVLIMALVLHVVVGASLAQLSWRIYLSLLAAPFYILWKCWVYVLALVSRGNKLWVRTQRAGSLP